jgi:hypothetical protein
MMRMSMTTGTVRALGALAFAALLTACSNDTALDSKLTNPIFQQIDRVGRPGINVLFAPWANHDKNSRSSPSQDSTLIKTDIGTFVTGTAGRSAAISSYVQTLLAPDVLVADLSSTATTATYLGSETGGKLSPAGTIGVGSTFGGRGLADDVMTANLGLAFGSTVVSLTAGTSSPIPDDGKSQTAAPDLTSAHVTAVRHATSTFPYLGAPL